MARPGTFPNANFPYAGNDKLTDEQLEYFRAEYAKASANEKVYNGKYATRSRKYSRMVLSKNRLGIDETQFNKYLNNPAQYWRKVLEQIPPRPWMTYSKVLKYLAACRPNEKALRLGLSARKMLNVWIGEVIQIGRDNDWTDTAELDLDNVETILKYLAACRPNHKALSLDCSAGDILSVCIWQALQTGREEDWTDIAEMDLGNVEPELFEAIRIVGDPTWGLGTMDESIMEWMMDTGLDWIMHNPEDRVIPRCWKWFADRREHKYKKALPTMATSDDDEETVTTNQPTIALYDDAVMPFVQIDPKAAGRAERLKAMEDTQYARGVAEETAKMIIKQALFGGPIEGHICSIIAEIFRKAGLSNAQQRDALIHRICLQTLRSDEYKAGSKLLDAEEIGKQIRELKDTIHHLQNKSDQQEKEIIALQRALGALNSSLEPQLHSAERSRNVFDE